MTENLKAANSLKHPLIRIKSINTVNVKITSFRSNYQILVAYTSHSFSMFYLAYNMMPEPKKNHNCVNYVF